MARLTGGPDFEVLVVSILPAMTMNQRAVLLSISALSVVFVDRDGPHSQQRCKKRHVE